MQQLEATKGKSVIIPRIVNRFIVMYYDKFIGWKCEYQDFKLYIKCQTKSKTAFLPMPC